MLPAGVRRAVLDITAGEMLYLPAGWWHQVVTVAHCCQPDT